MCALLPLLPPTALVGATGKWKFPGGKTSTRGGGAGRSLPTGSLGGGEGVHGRVLRSARQPTVTGSPGGGEDPPTNPILSLHVNLCNTCRNMLKHTSKQDQSFHFLKFQFLSKQPCSDLILHLWCATTKENNLGHFSFGNKFGNSLKMLFNHVGSLWTCWQILSQS